MGPMTGRGMGLCAGNDMPVYGRMYGRGYGRDLGYGRGYRGGGRGWRRWWIDREHIPPVPGPLVFPARTDGPVDERTYLEDALKRLQEEMSAIRKRLEEIGK